MLSFRDRKIKFAASWWTRGSDESSRECAFLEAVSRAHELTRIWEPSVCGLESPYTGGHGMTEQFVFWRKLVCQLLQVFGSCAIRHIFWRSYAEIKRISSATSAHIRNFWFPTVSLRRIRYSVFVRFSCRLYRRLGLFLWKFQSQVLSTSTMHIFCHVHVFSLFVFPFFMKFHHLKLSY
jgi:hypothetical protein